MRTTLTVIVLLAISNTFMTAAWYGHLKYKHAALWLTVLASWMIALPEYAFQVPANLIGYGQLSATQLKVIQEVVSLSVFAVFAALYLREGFECAGEIEPVFARSAELEDSLAQLRRELVGTIERVRDRHARDAEGFGDRRECGARGRHLYR